MNTILSEFNFFSARLPKRRWGFAVLVAALLGYGSLVSAQSPVSSPAFAAKGCGSAAGGTSAAAPTAGLCAPHYVAKPVLLSNGVFEWSCTFAGLPPSTAKCASEKAVNGACGTSSGSTQPAPPVSGLCATGQASQVVANATSYSWSCTASTIAQGGVPASCSATKPVAVCGAANGSASSTVPSTGLCTTGTASTVTSTATGYSWGCNLGLGGVSAACTAPKLSVCGTANGVLSWNPPSSTPAGNLCAVGTPTSVVQTQSSAGVQSYTWSCKGAGPANVTDVACDAPMIPRAQCGSANGVTSGTTPNAALCAVGQASVVVGFGLSTPWTWSCSGTATAATPNTVSCTAPNTSCGTANGQASATMPVVTCASGSVAVVTLAPLVTGQFAWRWSCGPATPIGGSCGAPYTGPTPVAPVCGAANGAVANSVPNTNLCAAGTANTVLLNGGSYAWSCTNTSTGMATSCQAPLPGTPSCGSASGGVGLTAAPTTGLCGVGVTSAVSEVKTTTSSTSNSQSGTTAYNWSCTGGSSSVACTAAGLGWANAWQVVGGLGGGFSLNCGSANGVVSFAQPSNGLCVATASAGAVTTQGLKHNWTCSAGSNVSICSAPLQ